jgi:hypothetical protein
MDEDNRTAAALSVYERYGENIDDAKRDQWRTVYYMLLLLSGLLAYGEIRDGVTSQAERGLILGSYFFSLCFSIRYLFSRYSDILSYRDEVERIRESIPALRELLAPRRGRRHADIKFPIAFSVVMSLGMAFLFTYLFPLCIEDETKLLGTAGSYVSLILLWYIFVYPCIELPPFPWTISDKSTIVRTPTEYGQTEDKTD